MNEWPKTSLLKLKNIIEERKMHNLTTTNDKETTMSHLEIASIAKKRSDNVKRTVEALAEQGVIEPPQIEEVNIGNNRTVGGYMINKRDSYVVMAQVNPVFTGRLVDRWLELEQVKPMTQMEMIAFQAQKMVEIEQQNQVTNARLEALEDKIEERITVLPSRPQGTVTRSELKTSRNHNIRYNEKFSHGYQVQVVEDAAASGEIRTALVTNNHPKAEGQHFQVMFVTDVNRILRNLV